MEKKELLYEGKAKQVYATEKDDEVIMYYKDDATALNGVKKGTIEDKGVLNNSITTMLFELVEKNGVKTHFIKKLDDRNQLCKKVQIVPLEVIVRNVAAGSMAKRLGLEEGSPLKTTVFEICYKEDKYDDPLINDTHAVAIGLSTFEELKTIYSMTSKINDILKEFFLKQDIKLIDFKIGKINIPMNIAKTILKDNISAWSKKYDVINDFDSDNFILDIDMNKLISQKQSVITISNISTKEGFLIFNLKLNLTLSDITSTISFPSLTFWIMSSDIFNDILPPI